MDRIVEEIALVPRTRTIQNQNDEEVSNNKNSNVFIRYDKITLLKRIYHFLILLFRVFNSKTYLKEFILWIVLFICLFLIAGPLALHISYSVPTIKTRNSANHIFSEERARDYLNNLTQYGSRVSNTRGNFDARDYLISQIKRISSMNNRQLRYELDLQNFTHSSHNQLQNILARVSNPFTKSKNIPSLMLSAHYDSGKCDSNSNN